jgi:hypothetical protein
VRPRIDGRYLRVPPLTINKQAGSAVSCAVVYVEHSPSSSLALVVGACAAALLQRANVNLRNYHDAPHALFHHRSASTVPCGLASWNNPLI